MVKKLLFIDDDKVTQMVNRYVMEDEGFCDQIIEAYNGKEALLYFRTLNKDADAINKLPEVILLDLNMPMMDGWTFFEIFEKEFPQFIIKIKIFILSSSVNPKDKERAINEPNIVTMLEKPLDPDQLQIINDALAKEKG